MSDIIKIFEIAPDAYKHYKANTKRGKKCSFEVVSRRLTAFIINPSEVKDMGLGSIIYKFGNFNIVVDYGTFLIKWMYWSDKRLPVTSKQSKDLEEIYDALGLSNSGRVIVGDIDIEKLEKIVIEKGFSTETKVPLSERYNITEQPQSKIS